MSQDSMSPTSAVDQELTQNEGIDEKMLDQIKNITFGFNNETEMNVEPISYYQSFIRTIDTINYTTLPDAILDLSLQPYTYLANQVPLQTKLYTVFLIFFFFGLLYPVLETAWRWIRALCHPITFPYKHVLIIGGDGGLGKALVQEMFMKGAYITMIGRQQEKLIKVAEQVDVRTFFDLLNLG